ncbi:MAG TPA: HDOD domain-containing protein [Phycisphaerae bacterium]|nr:HDOD domain-containing protein [Phycisphaerae bacterium]
MPASGLQRRKIELLLDGVDQLPTLPGVAFHVLELAMADHPARRDIQLALEVDCTLAMRTFRTAIDLNIPASALTSIDAVLDVLPDDALVAGLLSVEAVEADVVDAVELPQLARHILATAMAAQVIAARTGTIKPQVALLAGLLHDIGQFALRVLMPKAYGQVIRRLQNTGGDLLEAERDVLGIDHAVMGKRLAQRWGLPESLRNVIWLHHQAQVPSGRSAGVGPLTELVRLADLLARQYGFSYYAAEQVTENTAEVAERLGLSGIQAEQIGRQIGPVIELNALPLGLEARPSPDDLRRVLLGANARLGRLYQGSYGRCHAAEADLDQTHHLLHISADLATRHSTRQVLETIGTTACAALGLRVAVPYILAGDGGYIEGIRCTAAGGAEEHFLYDVANLDSLEPPPSQQAPAFAAPGGIVRAERAEGWLFERQGPQLGTGLFYAAPMTVENTRVGGLVFTLGDPPRELTPSEGARVTALTSVAAMALKRIRAEADLVHLSEELAETNRRLETAHHQSLQQRNVASLSEMATGAAHEINNPLAIISGRAQQLLTQDPAPGTRDILTTIVQQADRISEIITELQVFAKPPAPKFETVNPVALARQAADELAEAGASSGTSILVEARPGAPFIQVDAGQVAGAIGEIVKNGIEACSQAGGGTVRIVVQPLPAEAAARFVITDDGPGMDPEVRARAFDPFYSGYQAGRKRGLGLPKAYRAIQANGGQIALESAPDHGTTVRVTFRAAVPAPSESTQKPVRAQPS